MNQPYGSTSERSGTNAQNSSPGLQPGEVDLDAIEHFLDPRPREATPVTINGIEFQILNRASLIQIYQEVLDTMPNEKHLDEKRAKYQKKLENLKTR